MRKNAFIGSALVFAAMCLLLPAPCLAGAAGEDARSAAGLLEGKWSGTAYKPEEKPPSYQMTIAFSPSGSGSVEYPDLGCKGTLTYLKAEGDYIFYRERITDGKEKCTNGNTVRVRPRNGKLEWYWYGGRATANALLIHEKPSLKKEAQAVSCISCTGSYERDNDECAMRISDLAARAKCRDRAVNALRKCLTGCRN